MDYVIFGSGGFAREVAEIVHQGARATGHSNDARPEPIKLLGYLDDDASKHGSTVGGLPVLGGADWLSGRPKTGVLLGIGSPNAKRAIVQRLRAFDIAFPTLVDPTARIGSRVNLGQGVICCANVVLTCDITVGDFAAFNLAATVGHDSTIGPFSTVAPGCNLSGYTVLEEGVELGTNVSTVPGVRVGAATLVGAGAVVTRDLPSNVVAVGIPAKPR